MFDSITITINKVFLIKIFYLYTFMGKDCFKMRIIYKKLYLNLPITKLLNTQNKCYNTKV